MSCCARCLSWLRLKMPRIRKSSLTVVKRQLSSGTDAKEKFLIVGLCNYDMPTTRHSVGLKAIDKLALKFGVSWTRQRKLDGYLSDPVVRENMEILLLKSKSPMNLNGKAVYKAAKHFDVPPSQVYLIHDELDKIPGKYMMKNGGSARGHNGVRSVGDCLRSDVMPRLMVGVGRPADKADVAEYVLEDFTPDQLSLVDSVMDEALRTMMSHADKKCKEVIQKRTKVEDSNAPEHEEQ